MLGVGLGDRVTGIPGRLAGSPAPSRRGSSWGSRSRSRRWWRPTSRRRSPALWSASASRRSSRRSWCRLHDARDVDRRVVGGVGVAVGDRRRSRRRRRRGAGRPSRTRRGRARSRAAARRWRRPARSTGRSPATAASLGAEVLARLLATEQVARGRAARDVRLASSRSPVGMPLVLPMRSGSLMRSALRWAWVRPLHQALTASVSLPSRCERWSTRAAVSTGGRGAACSPSATVSTDRSAAMQASSSPPDPVAPGLEIGVEGAHPGAGLRPRP